MNLKLINSNIFSGNEESIILTIDGSRKGMEGNLTREFANNFPEKWKEIESTINYPLSLGKIFPFVSLDDFKYKYILIASTLNHTESLEIRSLETVIMNSLSNCLEFISGKKVKSVSCVLMKGGWRLNPLNAFLAMSNAIEKNMNILDDLDINIYFNNEEEYLKISSFARSIGW